MSYRPVACHSSAGVMTGMNISCAADRVHLLADDLDDLLVHAPPERQERPEAGAHLSDEAAAHEQLVARGLRVGGSLAQGR